MNPLARAWRLRHTLKLRFVLVAVGSALLAGAVSTFYVSRATQREALRFFMQQQSDEAEVVAGLLASKVDLHFRTLRVLSQRLGPAQLADPAAANRALEDAAVALTLFDEVQITGQDALPVAARRMGRMVARPELTPAARAQFIEVMRLGSEAVSNPLAISAALDTPSVYFVVPLRGPDSTVVGAVGGSVRLQSQGLLPPSLATLSRLDSDLVVFSRDGTVLSHPNPVQVLANVRSLPQLAPFYFAWLQHGALFHEEGLVEEVGGTIVASAGLPMVQWMVARMTPREAAIGPMQAVQHTAWTANALVVLLCALGAALLIVRIAHPITLLRQRAVAAIDDSTRPEQGWPEGQGEIGELARAMRHMTVERAAQTAAVETAARQLSALLAQAPVGIVITRRGRIELAGRAAADMLGYVQDELQGRPISTIYESPESYEQLGDAVRDAFRQQGFFDAEIVLRRKDGSEFWGHVQGRGIDSNEPERGSIWIVEDVTAAREARRRLSWSATHDALTGLVNRLEFESRLAALLPPPATSTLCVLFLDLDHFKAVNDTAGHAAGDDVLRHVSMTMQALVRSGDTVARMGGDEFAILLPGCPLQRAQWVAEQMRAAIDDYAPQFGGQVFRVSLSVGVCAVDARTMHGVAEVLASVDAACYAAKRQGRNRVVVCEESVACADDALPKS